LTLIKNWYDVDASSVSREGVQGVDQRTGGVSGGSGLRVVWVLADGDCGSGDVSESRGDNLHGDSVPGGDCGSGDVSDSRGDNLHGDWVTGGDCGSGDVSDSGGDNLHGDWVTGDVLDSREEHENWERPAKDDASWFDAPEDFQPTVKRSNCNKFVQTNTFRTQREVILRRKLHAARVSRDRYKKTVCMLRRKCKMLQSKCSAKAVKMSGLESVVNCVSRYLTGESLKFFCFTITFVSLQAKGPTLFG